MATNRVRAGNGGLLPAHTGRLLIQVTPEGSFTVTVSKLADGDGRIFDGALPIDLERGDYFIDVVPAARSHQRKRLKVHLSAGQVLTLPVVLHPMRPYLDAAPIKEVVPPVAPVLEEATLVPSSYAELKAPKPGALVRGRLADAEPKLFSREIETEALARYIRARKAAILGCYEKELRKNPALSGKVVVQFLITPKGRASEVGLMEDLIGNEAVGSCIKAILRSWVFPFKPSQSVQVFHSFAFSIARDSQPFQLKR